MRLDIRQVACIISNDTLSAGHITIENLQFYETLLGSAGFRLMREVTEHLEPVPAPVAYSSDLEQVIWALYSASGDPRNGWNQVPGHLFFVRT